MKEFIIKHPWLTFFGAIIIIPSVFGSLASAARPKDHTSGNEDESDDDSLRRLAGAIPDKK